MHDIVNINNLGDDVNRMQIYNIRAQLIIEKKVTEKNILLDLSHFPSGLYNVVVIDNNNEINSTHRIVKH